MEADAARRHSWLACPKCGHRTCHARVCDIAIKCKYCGCEFEAIIRIVGNHDTTGGGTQKFP
jgi:hypothetical protein